jgi:hypothetical protein
MHFSFPHRVLASCVAVLLLVGSAPLFAQPGESLPDPPPPDEPVSDTANADWAYDVLARLNASQAAYKDWKEGGGNNSLAFTAALGGAAEKKGERWAQAHELRLVFGIIDQANQELRKAEDQIRVSTNLQYQGEDFFKVFNPTAAINLRTQFASGFEYDSNPFEQDSVLAAQEPPVETSAFLAPAFITESIGLTYEPAEWMSIRMGAASKQTVVIEEDFRELYGVDASKVARVEAGAELASSVNYSFTENIQYRSQLDVFFSINEIEDPPDVLWENRINLKVNSWLSTDLEFVALYDKSTTDAIQLKETISLGVSFSLI